MTTTDTPEGLTFYCMYCPALGAYRFPFDTVPSYWQHLLTQFEWVPLYMSSMAAPPEGWTLRSYYCPPENAFYASYRTISEKTIKQGSLIELYAPPGAYGNDSAGHVPPQKTGKVS